MFDPNFNPLDQLERLKDLTHQLVSSHKQNTELQRQIVEQVNQLIGAVNNHDLQINEMHNRLRLLEVARQYESTKQNNTHEFDQDADVGQQNH